MKRHWRGGRRDVFAMGVLASMVASAYAQTRAEQDKAGPIVTVTGFRSSPALSASEKRDNVGLTDTVFSEDMGKFPDPNIADALARVPGVQVTRASIDGEGMNISIRGMGPAFTRVLLNGAPMASASGGATGAAASAPTAKWTWISCRRSCSAAPACTRASRPIWSRVAWHPHQ